MDQSEPFYILPFFRRNYKIILGLSFIAAILAGIISFFIKPEYCSSAVVFPPSSNSIEQVIENPNIGYDIEADRLQQIFQSVELKDSLIKKFQLNNYYGINTSEKDWKDKIYNKLTKVIKFERTRFMSIEISAITKDPVMSAAIVNYILEEIDAVRNRIYKVNITSATKALRLRYESQKLRSDSLLNLITQSKTEQKLLLKMDAEGKYNIVLNNSADLVVAQLMNQYLTSQSQTSETFNLYEKARAQAYTPVPSIYVVNKAFPSYNKVSPSYSKNIGATFLIVFFVSTLILYVREETNSFKK